MRWTHEELDDCLEDFEGAERLITCASLTERESLRNALYHRIRMWDGYEFSFIRKGKTKLIILRTPVRALR